MTRTALHRSPGVAITAGGILGVLITAAVLIATTSSDGVEIRDPAVGATSSATAAVYLDLVNTGDTAEQLVAASCDCAGRATLHRSSIGSDGLASMERVDRLDLAAGETLSFSPGGSHVMLEDLPAPLVAGDRVEIELEFASGATRSASVPVVDLAELAERERAATGQEGG